MEYTRLGSSGLKMSRIALGFGDGDRSMVDAVQRVAEARGVPMAQVALAWVFKNPVVNAPIVGATKPHHLPDAAAALDLRLSPTGF